jgi:hypothetical protein
VGKIIEIDRENPLHKSELAQSIVKKLSRRPINTISTLRGYGILSCSYLAHRQYTHYYLLSSITHQSFSTVFYFGRFLGIFAEFYEFFGVAVIAHLMPRAILSIEQLVST